jgi:hypothetical protein
LFRAGRLVKQADYVAVHIAGEPVDWVQHCDRCHATIQDNTAWRDERIALPDTTPEDRRGPVWWPVGERIGRDEHPSFPTITYIVGGRPLDDDERACTEDTPQLMATVSLKVTPDAIRAILRLPDNMTITGARVDTLTLHDGGTLPLLVLDLDAPSAPPNAVELAPSYERDGTAPDPIVLREVVWTHADGTHTIEPIAALDVVDTL